MRYIPYPRASGQNDLTSRQTEKYPLDATMVCGGLEGLRASHDGGERGESSEEREGCGKALTVKAKWFRASGGAPIYQVYDEDKLLDEHTCDCGWTVTDEHVNGIFHDLQPHPDDQPARETMYHGSNFA